MVSSISPMLANFFMEEFEFLGIRTSSNPIDYGEGMWMIPL